jgi:hypothetical protein
MLEPVTIARNYRFNFGSKASLFLNGSFRHEIKHFSNNPTTPKY